jgi:hypothetical protein
MTGLFRTIALAAFGIALAGQAEATNLFSNPGFDINASGWVLSGSGCTPATYSAGIGHPAGSITLNACRDASDPTASQTVSGLTIGGLYEIDWEIKLSGFDHVFEPNSFGVKVDGVLIDISDNPTFVGDPTSGFVADSTTFIATSTSHTFGFAAEINGTDTSYNLDNVRLAQVPEPAAIFSLGLGLTAVGLVARKKVRG